MTAGPIGVELAGPKPEFGSGLEIGEASLGIGVDTPAPTIDAGNIRRAPPASSFLKPGIVPPACTAGSVVEFRADEGGGGAADGAEFEAPWGSWSVS